MEWLSSTEHSTLKASANTLDPESNESSPVGELGEVVLATPYARRECFERPDATEETLVDGSVQTGDIGRFDEDGHLYLFDRANDTTVARGINVYSTKVETVLNEQPEIR